MADLAAIALLSLWFVLSVLNQFFRGRAIARIKRRDLFGVIPVWTFFAPNPGRSDYHVVYRDEIEGGEVTPWREIALRRDSWTRGVWHPDKRIAKGVSDIMAHFLRPMLREKKLQKSRFVEVPYILLLNHVEQQARDFQTERRQFAVAQTRSRLHPFEPEVLFVSARHRLDHEAEGGAADA